MEKQNIKDKQLTFLSRGNSYNVIVRVNGEVIKRVRFNKRLTKLLAGCALVGTIVTATILPSGPKHDDKSTNIDPTPTIETYHEATYDIPYEVQYGDTLSEIVYDYNGNANEVDRIIRDIVDKSDSIRNKNQITPGKDITLVDVPESKLDEYGYTVDYTILGPENEIADRRHYADIALQRYHSYEGINEEAWEFLNTKQQKLANMCVEAGHATDKELSEYFDDTILEEYRDFTKEVERLTGINFDNYRKPRLLSEYQKEIEPTL